MTVASNIPEAIAWSAQFSTGNSEDRKRQLTGENITQDGNFAGYGNVAPEKAKEEPCHRASVEPLATRCIVRQCFWAMSLGVYSQRVENELVAAISILSPPSQFIISYKVSDTPPMNPPLW